MTSRLLNRFVLKLEKFIADSFFNRTIHQPSEGYRYSIDPFILAAQITPVVDPHIIDIGCGCGIICLLLAHRLPFAQITGVEIQEELAGFARINIHEFEFENRIKVLSADINTLLAGNFEKKADIIVSNPPYKKRGTGRKNPNQQKAIARHEIMLNLTQLCNAADRLLSDSGKFYVIYPVNRLSELMQNARHSGLIPYFIRYVHPKPGEPVIRVLACFGKSSSSRLSLVDPFYLYDIENYPTDEHLSLFRS